MAHLKHTTWQTQRGLTLVELMVTIAVIAILATTAVSTMSNMRAKQQVIAAAEEVASIFQRAKSLARKESSDKEIEFLPSGLSKSYGITSTSGAVVTALGVKHPNVKISASRDDQKVSFSYVRGNASSAGSVCIAANTSGFDETDYEVKVVVAPSGRVRICSREGIDSRYSTDDCGACNAS